jgi:hypothetical protein
MLLSESTALYCTSSRVIADAESRVESSELRVRDEDTGARRAGLANTSVLTTVEELKGLINTLVSQVDEAFLDLLKPKAQKLFFIPKEQSTLFYKEHVRENLEKRFATELAAPPPGATSRTNGTWRISAPTFVRKTRSRIQWASRIDVEAEASKPATHGNIGFAYFPSWGSNDHRPGGTVVELGGTQLRELFRARGTGQ